MKKSLNVSKSFVILIASFLVTFFCGINFVSALGFDNINLIKELEEVYPTNFTSSNNKTFFTLTSENIVEFWSTDGTENSDERFLVIDTNYYDIYGNFVATNNKLYYTLYDLSTEHATLYASDGTIEGTDDFYDFGVESNERFVFDSFMTMSNMLYFITYDATRGYILWVTDGTEEGTEIVLEGPNDDGDMTLLYADNDRLYFMIEYYDGETELWYAEGSESTLITYGQFSIEEDAVMAMNNKLYFSHYDETTGEELWVTEGTEAGTHIVKDINEGDSGSYPYSLFLYNNKIYFSVEEYYYDEENEEDVFEDKLYVTDGTEVGTYEVPGFYDLNIDSFEDGVVFGGKIYFSNDDDSAGDELWVSDGTAAGTHMVKDVVEGERDSEPHRIKVINNELYFLIVPESYYDTDYCLELWKSDGTENGTVRIEAHIPAIMYPAINIHYSKDGIYYLNQPAIHDLPINPMVNLMHYVTPEQVEVTEYSVAFKDYNGTTLKTQTVVEGSGATAPSNPSRSGYTFKGWDKAFNNVTSNITVTATYTKNAVTTSAPVIEEEIVEEEPVLEINSVTSELTETEVEDYNFIIKDETNGKTLIDVYDINLLLKGQKVQPDGTLEIRILMTEKQKNYENLEVLYVDDNNNVTTMPHRVDGDYIVFTVNHLSKYVLVGDVKEDETPIVDDLDDKNIEEEKEASSNPIIFVAAGAFILLIIIIILVKRRKKD